MKTRSIRYKIVRLVLLVSGLVLGTVCLSMFFTMNTMRSNTVHISRKLGSTAAEDAKAALSDQAKQNISELAGNKADYIEQRFAVTETYVSQIADEMTRIYEKPHLYPDRIVSEPLMANKDILAAQLMYSSIVKDRTEVAKEVGKVANIQDFLYQIVKNDKVCAAAYIATKTGIVIMADDYPQRKFEEGSKKPAPYEAFTRPWYMKAKKEQKQIFTDVIKDIHGGGLAIVCAQPFYKNGEFMGVAGVGSFLNDVNELVTNTEIGKTGYAFILNDKGQVTISPKTEGEVAADPDQLVDLRTVSNKALAKTAEKMTAGESGIAELTIDKKPVYLAYQPMKTLGWSFAVAISVEEVLAPANESNSSITAMSQTASTNIDRDIRRIILLLLILAAAVSGFAVIIAVRWANRLTVPIGKLLECVGDIGRGNLDADIQIKTGDEVETLASSFNKMTAQLREHIKNLTAVTAEKERIGAELGVATHIQASMLPCIFPAFPDISEIDIYASMTPAKEVGGDFYDFFLVDSTHLAVVMADVSGKGVPAALFMVIAKTLIKNHMQLGKTPAEVFTAVNEQLCENNDAGMFVTAFMGVLNFTDGNFVYVNAGHNAPLIRKSSGGFEWLKARPGFVLAGMEGIKYRQAELTLQKGDIFFTYTDGVTEAQNPLKALYSDKRLIDTLNRENTKELSVEELVQYIHKDVDAFASGAEQADDITLLALKYIGGDTTNTSTNT